MNDGHAPPPPVPPSLNIIERHTRLTPDRNCLQTCNTTALGRAQGSAVTDGVTQRLLMGLLSGYSGVRGNSPVTHGLLSGYWAVTQRLLMGLLRGYFGSMRCLIISVTTTLLHRRPPIHRRQSRDRYVRAVCCVRPRAILRDDCAFPSRQSTNTGRRPCRMADCSHAVSCWQMSHSARCSGCILYYFRPFWPFSSGPIFILLALSAATYSCTQATGIQNPNIRPTAAGGM